MRTRRFTSVTVAVCVSVSGCSTGGIASLPLPRPGVAAKMNARTGQISEAMAQTSQLAASIDAKDQVLADVLDSTEPATDVLSRNAPRVSDLAGAIGDTAAELAKFPSVSGTDTSGHSVVADANLIANSFNDVVLTPDATLFALNRLIPTFVKTTPSNAMSVSGGIDRLVLGSIPDIGYPGDPGMHGPKWSNFQQMIGAFKYTLWRLQERVAGQGR